MAPLHAYFFSLQMILSAVMPTETAEQIVERDTLIHELRHEENE